MHQYQKSLRAVELTNCLVEKPSILFPQSAQLYTVGQFDMSAESCVYQLNLFSLEFAKAISIKDVDNIIYQHAYNHFCTLLQLNDKKRYVLDQLNERLIDVVVKTVSVAGMNELVYSINTKYFICELLLNTILSNGNGAYDPALIHRILFKDADDVRKLRTVLDGLVNNLNTFYKDMLPKAETSPVVDPKPTTPDLVGRGLTKAHLPADELDEAKHEHHADKKDRINSVMNQKYK